jgi:hypothetical protein
MSAAADIRNLADEELMRLVQGGDPRAFEARLPPPSPLAWSSGSA